MDQLRNIAIVIPVYEASAELRVLVDGLLKIGAPAIVVIDDGSIRSPAAKILGEVTDPRVQLYAHQKNEGKGRALKTGFQRLLAHQNANFKGVITVDADGQHLITDVLKVAEAAIENPKNLVVGSRRFRKAGIPLRSRLGNILTRTIFRLATGISVRDTQSGLRFLPAELLDKVCRMPGERYEFELRMLTEIANSGIGISQPEISTTYVDGNRSSHFRPLLDSARIYAVFMRYCAVSVLSAIADLIIFGLLVKASSSILAATYAARVCSASFNFYGNRRFAFGGNQQKYSVITQLSLYVTLAFVSASISAALLQLVGHLSVFYLVMAKSGIDITLFFFNFATQKFLIFRSNRPMH